MNDLYQERKTAIRRYLEGEKPSHIYTDLGHSQAWFFKWTLRDDRAGLDGLNELSRAPKRQADQPAEAIEQTMVNIRHIREKRERDETRDALIGAVAIHKELQALGYTPPSVQTIHHILVRYDLVAPVPTSQAVREVMNRHYPACAVTRPRQLQQLDLVGPRYLSGSSQRYYFYNLRDACSRRVALEVGKNHQANTIVKALIRSWQRMGRSSIFQHDTALEFRGSNRYPRSAGLLTKRCFALGIESIFIPAHEPYRHGSIEHFTGLFQRLVLHTQPITDFAHLPGEVQTFAHVANTHHPHESLQGKTALEYERALNFQPTLLAPNFTFSPRFHFTQPPEGKVSFICRIRKRGNITIASEKFEIDPTLAGEYVYATIFVKEQTLTIYHTGTVITEFPDILKT